jgi:hypothetical protein
MLCSINLPPPENRAIYVITWKNVVEPERPRIKIRSTRIVRWLNKATGCSIYCFSTATKITRTRLNVSLNSSCPSFSFLPRDGNLYKIII